MTGKIASVSSVVLLTLALGAVPAEAQRGRPAGGMRGGAVVVHGGGRAVRGPVVRGGVRGPVVRGPVVRGGVRGPVFSTRGVGVARGRFGVVGVPDWRHVGPAYHYGVGSGPYAWYGARRFGYALHTPYYRFRPWRSLGFGLYSGYPIQYPYWAYPPAYGYGSITPYVYDVPTGSTYDRPSTYARPGELATPEATTGTSESSQYGGLSFAISPDNAGIYVDGIYVGLASMFTATSEPLTLMPGRHHVEIQRQGYNTMAFDVDVAPGQVIPYEGTMERIQ